MGDWAWSHGFFSWFALSPLSPHHCPPPGAWAWTDVGEAPRGAKDGSWGPRRNWCPWWSQGVTRCNTRATELSPRSVGAPVKCRPDPHVSPCPHPAPPAMQHPFSKFQDIVNSVMGLKTSVLPLLFTMEHYEIIDIYVSSALRKIFPSVSPSDESRTHSSVGNLCLVLFSSCSL